MVCTSRHLGVLQHVNTIESTVHECIHIGTGKYETHRDGSLWRARRPRENGLAVPCPLREASIAPRQMQRRRDEVDVLRDVFRERIRTLERDALVAVLIVAVDVVLRLEDILCLRDGHVQVQRAAIRAETDLLGMDAAVLNEPVVYGVDGLLGRAEDLCDPRGCPELSVARGLGVRDFEEVLIELVEVGLRQGYLQRNDDVRVSATLERPAHGGKRAGLVNNAFRKDRRVGCRSDGDNSSGELDEDPRQQHHKSSDRPRK